MHGSGSRFRGDAKPLTSSPVREVSKTKPIQACEVAVSGADCRVDREVKILQVEDLLGGQALPQIDVAEHDDEEHPHANAQGPTVLECAGHHQYREDQDMWLPLSIDAGALGRREGAGLKVIARMSKGVTLEAVRTQIGTVAKRLEQQYPELNRDIVPVVRL